MESSYDNADAIFEEQCKKRDAQLKQEELETSSELCNIFNGVQDLKNVLDNITGEYERYTAIECYGDDFVCDVYELQNTLKRFIKKYEELY